MTENQVSYQDRFVLWLQLRLRALLLSGLVLALLVSAFLYWQQRREHHLEEASRAYAGVLESMERYSVARSDPESVLDQVESMQERFPKVFYTLYARLLAVRILAEQERYYEALEASDALLEADIRDDLRAFVTLNRARILLALDTPDLAIETLDEADSDFVSPAYLELRGDIYFEQEDYSAASSMYAQAAGLYGGEVPISLTLKLQMMRTFLPR